MKDWFWICEQEHGNFYILPYKSYDHFISMATERNSRSCASMFRVTDKNASDKVYELMRMIRTHNVNPKSMISELRKVPEFAKELSA